MPGVGPLRRRASDKGVVAIRMRPGILLGGWTVRMTSIAPGERRKTTRVVRAADMAAAQRLSFRMERKVRGEWAAAAAQAAKDRKRRFRRRTPAKVA